MGALASAGVQNASEWQRVLERLRALMREEDSPVPNHRFENWIKGKLGCRGREDRLVTLTFASDFVLNYVQRNLGSIIQQAYSEVVGICISLEFEIDRDLENQEPVTSQEGRSQPLASVLPARQGQFEPIAQGPFLVGDSNQVAYSAVKEFVTEGQLATRGVLIIYGPCGVGKTHLTELAAGWFKEANPSDRGGAFLENGSNFVSQFVLACQYHEVDKFHTRRSKRGLYILDSLDYLADGQKTETLKELAVLLDDLAQKRARVLVMSQELPSKLVTRLRNRDLASRLLGAVALPIGLPDRDLRFKLIKESWSRSKVDRCLYPEAETIDLLADQVLSVRELLGLNETLITQVRLSKRAMSKEEIKAWLGDRSQSVSVIRMPDCLAIVDAVASHFCLTKESILGRGRSQPLVVARQVAMWLCRHSSDRSLAAIGDTFNKDHSTVCAAVAVVDGNESLKDQATLIAKRGGWTLK
jgi:chromosomal replication initiator protein